MQFTREIIVDDIPLLMEYLLQCGIPGLFNGTILL